MGKTMDQTEECTFSFGIEPITKRAYHHTGNYKKKTKTRRHRKSGLKYRKIEENTEPLVLVGFTALPSEPVAVSQRRASL
jgi:hypothetical protein